MAFLIDIINDNEKQKYIRNANREKINVMKPISKREYLIPNNAKSSITYFWQNVLLINPAADGHTFPMTFIPVNNNDIIVRARFSNHPCGPIENWTKYEARGCPNKRVDIYFYGADDSDNTDEVVETHVISNKHLYSDDDVKLIQQSLCNFFDTGKFVNPFCHTIENTNNNQIQKENRNMKQTIRLTESNLNQIVKESVNKILNEADSFKQVDNLNDYVASNGLQMKPASKFQRVNAQSGKSYINQYGKQNGMDKRQIGRMVRKGGAPLSTVAGDGTQETNNMVTKNHTVLNNVGNTANRWVAETPTFTRKYEQDPAQQGVYKPKGGPMNAAQINEPISFTAPWGERMNIDKGGYILQDPNNPNDTYGISGKDFDSTYRFNEGKNRIRMSETQLRQIIKESIEQVLNEVSPEYYTNAANKAQKSINGFKGKMMKTFMPKQYNKRQRQATQFRDMSNDHPQDEWEITNQQMGSNPYDAQTYYTLRNTRTGEQRGCNDGSKGKPFRGRVIAGQGGDNEDASWLNDNQYNPPRR